MSTGLIMEQLLQMGLMFGSIRAASYLGWDQPEKINTLRTCFATATALYYAFGLIIWQLAKSRDDPTPLVYDEPVNGQEQPDHFETTVGQYDVAQVVKMLKGSAFSTVLVAGLHFYFKITQPLIIQSVLPLVTILKSPLFGIYILGMKATGSFERPWTVKSPFGNSLNTPAISEPVQPAADSKTSAIKDAPKSASEKKSE